MRLFLLGVNSNSLLVALVYPQNERNISMKRSFIFSIGLVMVFGITAFAQDATPAPSPSPKPKPTINKKAIQAQLVKIENDLWKAFGEKNGKPFQARLASD